LVEATIKISLETVLPVSNADAGFKGCKPENAFVYPPNA
jgi:hypothetical protein